MKLKKYITNIAACMACAIAGALSLTSCNGLMYDQEGDCDPHHKVKFVFDRNLNFADAFSKEVNAVTLYVIDSATGNIVWQKTESGDQVRSDGYLMDVPVAPGDYKLLAWCGEGLGPHFIQPDGSHYTNLQCTLLRDHDAAGAFSDKPLNRLYHGHFDKEHFTEDEGTHIHTVELVKDTNHINIVLQNLSGKPIDKDDFTFTITDNNGLMEWDNSLLPDENITYRPHTMSQGSAGVDTGDDTQARAISQVNTCVAQFTTGRLVKGQNTTVTITNKEGKKVLSLPVIDYALLVKGHYGDLEDQDYLDRQDKYDMVFFLDERNEWIDAYVMINSWKVVLQDTNL